jgi:MoxR-like ATPase
VLARHAGGFDPRDLTTAGSHRSRAPPTSRRVRGGAAVEISPEVIGYIVDLARATRNSPSLSLGGQPPWGDRADGDGARLGVAQRTRLRHPRRRQGPRHATLAHRLTLRPEAELEGVGIDSVLDSALNSVPVPR